MSHPDPLDLDGQQRWRQDQQERQRLVREIEDADIKWLMGRDRGRRIVWRILEQSGVYQMSFSTNAMLTAFNEGQRSFGNRLLIKINALCPELFPVMAKEAKEQELKQSGNGHKSN